MDASREALVNSWVEKIAIKEDVKKHLSKMRKVARDYGVPVQDHHYLKKAVSDYRTRLPQRMHRDISMAEDMMARRQPFPDEMFLGEDLKRIPVVKKMMLQNAHNMDILRMYLQTLEDELVDARLDPLHTKGFLARINAIRSAIKEQ